MSAAASRWSAGRWARLALSLLAAAALLAAVFWLADLDELGRRLSGARRGLVAWSLAAYTTTYLARARRLVAAGARASTWVLLWVVAIHAAANRVMPLKTGELVYPVVAKRVGAAGYGEGLVQLVVIRVMDLLTVATLFLLALGLSTALGLADLGSAGPAFVAGAVALVAASAAALLRLSALLGLALRAARRLVGPRREGRLARALDRAESVTAAARELGPRRMARMAGWSAVLWLAYFVTFHLILLSLGVDLPFLRTVLGSSAAIVASIVPVSGLGTFGALEGGWTAGFVAVGLEASTAASTAILMSGLTLAFGLVLAAAGWVALGARRPPPRPAPPGGPEPP